MIRFVLLWYNSAVNVSETPAVATVEKKEYVYETKEEAKQAFKELLREKASWYVFLKVYNKIDVHVIIHVRVPMIFEPVEISKKWGFYFEAKMVTINLTINKGLCPLI